MGIKRILCMFCFLILCNHDAHTAWGSIPINPKDFVIFFLKGIWEVVRPDFLSANKFHEHTKNMNEQVEGLRKEAEDIKNETVKTRQAASDINDHIATANLVFEKMKEDFERRCKKQNDDLTCYKQQEESDHAVLMKQFSEFKSDLISRYEKEAENNVKNLIGIKARQKKQIEELENAETALNRAMKQTSDLQTVVESNHQQLEVSLSNNKERLVEMRKKFSSVETAVDKMAKEDQQLLPLAKALMSQGKLKLDEIETKVTNLTRRVEGLAKILHAVKNKSEKRVQGEVAFKVRGTFDFNK